MWSELPIGNLTPADVLEAIGGRDNGFILESAGGMGRWSFVGAAPALVLGDEPGDPLGQLRPQLAPREPAESPAQRPAVPPEVPFFGGAVGMLGYEAARRYERLPVAGRDALQMPDAWFGIHETVAAMDHDNGRIVLCATADGTQSGSTAQRRLDEWAARIGAATAAAEPRTRRAVPDREGLERSTNMSREAFAAAVERSQAYITAGDIFQVQISRRFSRPLHAHPLQLFRTLRAINPSPYMVYLAMPGVTLVGASPEMLVRVRDGHITYHPIAGTRRRGRNPEDDARMEQELRTSEKERAEHLMLVDLGRNDVGRVSATGSVRVTELMEVERYSHVMHLVSTVQARLAAGLTALDALRACFPAGTVTGAPKIRAMEIIAELEPETRGAYAGAVGWVGFGGDLDTAIALRTIVVQDGVAHVQAAAGVVADSIAEQELLEVDNKVAAQLQAIAEVNAA